MNGPDFLLDTSIMLYLLGGDKVLASILGNHKPHLSFITEMELLSSPTLTKPEETAITNFISVCTVVGLTIEIKESAILLHRGVVGLKLPDSIIAATAECTGTLLLTADKGFERLKSMYILQYQKV